MAVTYDSHYKEYPINTDKDKTLGCNTKILDKYHDHIQDMINRHNKVVQLRFDLHYPTGNSITPNQKQLHDFTRNVKRDLSKNYRIPSPERQRSKEKFNSKHDVDPRIIKVTEKHDCSSNPHLHGLLLVNGNVKNSVWDMRTRIERQWKNALQTDNAKPLVDYCNKDGENPIFIDRNSPNYKDQLDNAYYQASYLAKTRGKENKTKYSWSVNSTRIPKK